MLHSYSRLFAQYHERLLAHGLSGEYSYQLTVMTTKEMERGKNKCASYWPEREIGGYGGEWNLRALGRTFTTDYILREFIFQKMNHNSRNLNICITIIFK